MCRKRLDKGNVARSDKSHRRADRSGQWKSHRRRGSPARLLRDGVLNTDPPEKSVLFGNHLLRFGVSIMVLTRSTIFIILLISSGCGRRTNVALPSTAAPQPESLYTQGLADFHQGTPEGYMKAAAALRTAWRLKPDRCDYALNLAQSLLFLSTEQILNWEEYEPRQSEALAVVDAAEPRCPST